MKSTLCLVVCSIAFSAIVIADPCSPPETPSDLTVREGYLDFISPAELQPFKDALPRVAHAETERVLQSSDTIWYDESSMVFTYQDSIEVVVGVRANCVGRVVGERNISHPQISKLMNLFGADFRFLFPFRTAAGTDNVTNKKVFNFWSPPRKNGSILPVRWWKRSSRGRWHWVFPVGTLFGEVLYQKSPNGRWYVFEIRTRKRYRDGWEVDTFRPFRTAAELAQAITARRNQWRNSKHLRGIVQYLQNKNTLVAHTMQSQAYAQVFTPINGALDPIPAIKDTGLIEELLSLTPFVSTQGAIWKENGTLETYAPSSQSNFSIVPKGYEMGMIPVNEVSCNRCHSEVGRALGEFEGDVVLYGEIWGEDRIFTWHPFQVSEYIFGTWDMSDSPTRTINSNMVQARLIQQGKPSATELDYKMLPHAFQDPFANRKEIQ